MSASNRPTALLIQARLKGTPRLRERVEQLARPIVGVREHDRSRELWRHRRAPEHPKPHHKEGATEPERSCPGPVLYRRNSHAKALMRDFCDL
jgi:hypothetical protein